MTKLCLGGIEIAQNVMLDLRVVDNELWVRHNGISEGCELVMMYRKYAIKSSRVPKIHEKKWRIRYGGIQEIISGYNYTLTKCTAYKWYAPQLVIGETLYGTTIKTLGDIYSGSPSSDASYCLGYMADVDEGKEEVNISSLFRKRATKTRNVHLPFALAIVKYGGTGPHDRNQILAFKRFNVNIIYDRVDGCFKETLSI